MSQDRKRAPEVLTQTSSAGADGRKKENVK